MRSGSFDVWGFLAIATGLFTLLLALTAGQDWGWTSYKVLFLLTVAVLSLALFIVIHLLHFTTGTLLPGFIHLDPYANLVLAFRTQRLMAVFYVGMMVVVGLHLYHGTWSAIRTLGLSRPRRNPFSRPVATILAVALWLGFTAVPVGVLLGVIGPQPAGQAASR